ncbi:LysR family transcriptional regulator [Microvirga aerophila]|uniref:LysR family transcriptional regulator n=2 Tax=Microvirga aerophila TaxID=670291 RepID=A0A512BNX4_9HYPH|nr:LysR family transcriptional regulator [Microvirga aerophila]
MNLRDLRYILAIAEHGHFGRAAKACHVSQPTLSGQVRRLEDYLGVAIFERRTRSVVPTEVGRRILDHARQALAHADAIEGEARAARDPFAGPLRLGVIPTVGPYLMPLVLRPLRARHPMLSVELWEDVTDDLIERLRDGTLDGILVGTEVPGADLASVPLFEEPFLAVLPATHPLAHAGRLEGRDLAPDMLVLADPHCLRDQTLAACGGHDARARALRAASLETLVNMVAAEYGTMVIPMLAARVSAVRDVVVRPLVGGVGRTVRLVSRKSFQRGPALDAVADVIREAANNAMVEFLDVLSARPGSEGNAS